MSRQQQGGRGGGGPIGGVIKLLGTGIGAAAEYHEHRKERKLSRENSRQDVNAAAGPSNSLSQQSTRDLPSSSDAPPPAYSDVAGPSTSRLLAAGKPATDDKKAAHAQYDDHGDESTDDDDISSVEDDEEDWELDELGPSDSAGLPSYEQSEKEYTSDDLVKDVMDKKAHHKDSLTRQPSVHQPLPYPVILPQRRPRNKTRGFVRAYAPLLGECSGIDQDTFLSFLENFYKSSQASPIFGIIELSAAIAGIAPEPIIMAVTTAVQVAARVGEEIQQRHRTNDFLNKINESLFQPAGLYAMIVKYKSDAEIQASGNSMLARFGVASQTVDFNTNQAIAKYNRTLSDESSGHRGMSDRLQNIRLASGTTKGSINLPAAAPLVFPHVDNAIVQEGPETFKDKAKDARGFLQDYMDRRAQLKYAREDPNSALQVPESERTFKSKWADPQHPMYNSGPIGFLSGGYLARDRQSKQDRRAERREDRGDRRIAQYERRMDSGRNLSRKKQRRYDAYMAQRGMDPYARGGPGGYYDGGYGGRGPRHPMGFAGGMGGALGAGAYSREYEDSYGYPAGPPADYGRRSFDSGRRGYDDRSVSPGRENAPVDYAPYGGQSAYYGAGRGDPRYGGRGGRGGRGGGGAVGAVKRMMREDVLYLMIVNMPSEEEMAVAREKLDKAKRGN